MVLSMRKSLNSLYHRIMHTHIHTYKYNHIQKSIINMWLILVSWVVLFSYVCFVVILIVHSMSSVQRKKIQNRIQMKNEKWKVFECKYRCLKHILSHFCAYSFNRYILVFFIAISSPFFLLFSLPYTKTQYICVPVNLRRVIHTNATTYNRIINSQKYGQLK